MTGRKPKPDENGNVSDIRLTRIKINDIFAHIIMKCLEPDPNRRYQSAEELLNDLKNIQTKDIAMKKAEELLAKTQAYKIDELKGNNISISIGISTAPQDGDCYMDLYKRADQALYQAKRSGKARVCNYFS